MSKLTVFPKSVRIPDELEKIINKEAGCLGEYCLLIWEQGSKTAQFVTSQCPSYYDRHVNDHARENGYQYCPPMVTHMNKKEGKWEVGSRYNYRNQKSTKDQREEDKLTISNAIKQGDIDIRTVKRKQIFIGGKPVGRFY